MSASLTSLDSIAPRSRVAWMVLALSGTLITVAQAQTAPSAGGAASLSPSASGVAPTVPYGAGSGPTPAPATATAGPSPSGASAAPTTNGNSASAQPGTQTPAAAPPPASPPLPAPPTVSHPAQSDRSAESARLDEIEQIARIADRKHEILAEEAEKRKKEAPVVKIDDKGFSLALPDRSFVLRIRGLVQADGRFFVDNDALAANDTFLVRKFRPALEGTLFSVLDFKLVPEFAGTVQILDGYADLHPWDWLRLRVGKYKAPIGLERLQGDADRSFLEQTLVANLSSQRDVGAALWGDVAGGIVNYTIGIFNGAPDTTGNDTDTNHAKDVQGRIFFQPFHGDLEDDIGKLGVGIAAGTGNRKGRLPTSSASAVTGLSALKTAGQNTFFQYLAPATDTTGATTTFTHERATRVNPQLYFYRGGLGLLAEYLWLSQGVQKGNVTTELKHQAAGATLSYAFNGTSGFDGVTPTHGFDLAKGKVGAFEIAARWSWLKLDDATFGDPAVQSSVQYANPTASAKRAQAYGGTLTWIPRRSFHLAASFEHTEFKGGAGTAKEPANRAPENVIIARAQLAF